MAARQLGYYHAIVEGQGKPRLEILKSAGGEPELPSLEGLDRLWEAWGEIGRAGNDGPVTWVEIESFGRIEGLSRDDMVVLRRMSAAYVEGTGLTHALAIEPMDTHS